MLRLHLMQFLLQLGLSFICYLVGIFLKHSSSLLSFKINLHECVYIVYGTGLHNISIHVYNILIVYFLCTTHSFFPFLLASLVFLDNFASTHIIYKYMILCICVKSRNQK